MFPKWHENVLINLMHGFLMIGRLFTVILIYHVFVILMIIFFGQCIARKSQQLGDSQQSSAGCFGELRNRTCD